jgi:hypothetical protein
VSDLKSTMTITERVQKVLAGIRAKRALATKASEGTWLKAKTCIGIPAVMESCQSVALMGIRQSGRVDFDLPNWEANSDFIADARTTCPLALDMLETSIEGLLQHSSFSTSAGVLLAALCDQWDAAQFK